MKIGIKPRKRRRRNPRQGTVLCLRPSCLSFFLRQRTVPLLNITITYSLTSNDCAVNHFMQVLWSNYSFFVSRTHLIYNSVLYLIFPTSDIAYDGVVHRFPPVLQRAFDSLRSPRMITIWNCVAKKQDTQNRQHQFVCTAKTGAV